MSDTKIVTMTTRIDKELKERFVRVSKSNDTDASKLIRQWIKEYLRKNAQTKMDFK